MRQAKQWHGDNAYAKTVHCSLVLEISLTGFGKLGIFEANCSDPVSLELSLDSSTKSKSKLNSKSGSGFFYLERLLPLAAVTSVPVAAGSADSFIPVGSSANAAPESIR